MYSSMKHTARIPVLLASAFALALTLGARTQDGIVPSRVDVLDFEGLPAGTILAEVVGRHGVGPVGVHGFNPQIGATNAAVVFDSSAPTGGDDDLGTPNEDFGGPGEGDGGGQGSPYANKRAQRNLLVVADDLTDGNGDGLVDDPGDAPVAGAQLLFDFSALGGVTALSVTVVDVEARTPASRVDMFDSGGLLVGSVDLPNVGNNGAAVVDLGRARDVHQMLFTLNGSAAVDDLWFSIPANGAVSGHVWDDLDDDGLEEASEPGLAGVVLTLEGVSAGSQSTVTDDDGRYAFASLAPGSYVLTVDPASVPAGSAPSRCDVGGDDTIDSDCSPLALDLAPGAVLGDVDFGYAPGCNGRIGDYVFDDLNGNNVQDAQDVGITGATLFLHDHLGNVVATTLSDADGKYEFTGLCEGDYMVSIDISTATNAVGVKRGPSICDVGGNEDLDSECGPECIGLGIALTASVESDLSVDWGYRACEDCDGKLDGLSMRYHGGSVAFVEVIQHDGTLVFAGDVGPEGDFSFFGMDHQNTLGRSIDILVDGRLHTQLHTSCSQVIVLGMHVGDFEVLAASSRNGGAICEETE